MARLPTAGAVCEQLWPHISVVVWLSQSWVAGRINAMPTARIWRRYGHSGRSRLPGRPQSCHLAGPKESAILMACGRRAEAYPAFAHVSLHSVLLCLGGHDPASGRLADGHGRGSRPCMAPTIHRSVNVSCLGVRIRMPQVSCPRDVWRGCHSPVWRGQSVRRPCEILLRVSSITGGPKVST
jgi:hypothetical protein